MISGDANSLCLQCGLCCNGVIFARGELQPGDNREQLRRLGLALIGRSASATKAPKFRQPCAVLDNCRCRIYEHRPQYCRQFECLLLKSVLEGRTDFASASAVVRKALRRVKRVKALLIKLGDDDGATALDARFRRVQKWAEEGALDREAFGIFGDLTMAMHDLNWFLGEKFYPGH